MDDHWMLNRVRDEYRRALRLPVNAHERIYGQQHMCFLRDLIADAEGRDSETIQDEYERDVVHIEGLDR